MKLDTFTNEKYDRGASFIRQCLWYYLGAPIFQSRWIVSSAFRAYILRLFGASIGSKVVFKPGIKIKFPWKISIGDYSWIGERVWLDSIGRIDIGSHVCISQDVYICSGSHDWSLNSFDLLVKPIVVKNGVWLAARSSLAPGALVEEQVVLTMGSVGIGCLESGKVYTGNPALPVKDRKVQGPS